MVLQKEPEEEVDLLGGGDDLLGMGSTTTSAPPAPQATADDDLLGLAFGGDTATTNFCNHNRKWLATQMMRCYGAIWRHGWCTNNSNDNNNSVGGTDDLLGGLLGDLLDQQCSNNLRGLSHCFPQQD